LRSVYATELEFLLESFQVVKIGTYIKMPVHAVFPRDDELQIRIRLSSN
jgi:hypothetical protein